MAIGHEMGKKIFFDSVLPFGFHSAPKLFDTLAYAIELIAHHEGVDPIFHYLDDFLVIGAPGSPEYDAYLAILPAILERLGVPIAPEKLESPPSCLTFLEIEIDSISMEMQLPESKLRERRMLLYVWVHKRSCQKRDLCSLIGKLQHTAKVVQPGETFLRQMFEQLAVAKKMHHHVRLNQSFWSDLTWWNTFLAFWKGVY